jgi:hypothetical protein
MEGSSADIRLDRDEEVLGELREGCHARDNDANAVFDRACFIVSQDRERLRGLLRDNEQRHLHVGCVARPHAGGVATISSSAIDKPKDTHNAGPICARQLFACLHSPPRERTQHPQGR